MNALFYFHGYNPPRNQWERWLLTVPDGPHDRHAQALEILRENYPKLTNWSGKYICLTKEEIFKEL